MPQVQHKNIETAFTPTQGIMHCDYRKKTFKIVSDNDFTQHMNYSAQSNNQRHNNRTPYSKSMQNSNRAVKSAGIKLKTTSQWLTTVAEKL